MRIPISENKSLPIPFYKGARRIMLYSVFTAVFLIIFSAYSELILHSEVKNCLPVQTTESGADSHSVYQPTPVTQPGGNISNTAGALFSSWPSGYLQKGIHIDIAVLLITVIIAVVLFSMKKQVAKKNAALRISREKFRLIFEHSPVGIIHFDRNGIITECNTSFEQIVGSKREKLIGLDMRTIRDIRAAQAVRHVLSGNTGTYDDIYTSITSEKTTPVRAMLSPLFNGSGSITGGIGIIEDVTVWKLYEEKLVNARESAERANRIKNIFLANMSHEVRTPLNGILGLLQVLQSSCSDAGQNDLISMAIKSGKRLTRLLSDILDLTKIESEQFSLIIEDVNIRETISSIQKTLSEDYSGKNIEIRTSVSGSVPEFIRGDELRIRQILQNLAENSFKFTNEGSITISAGFELTGEKEGILKLKVTDTGIGIESDKLSEILEPFRQVENNYTRKFQGAGLGLAIVRKLVSLMDGNIEIQSTPGAGTGVECTMKVETCTGSQAKTSEGFTDERASVKSLRILLVEDDRINSLMIKRLLEKMNHSVTDASNGIEALESLGKADFDLVLMDIQMPEMNGIEAIKEIRKPERFGYKSSICSIALTAYAMAGDREKFIEAGFDEYLPKPVDTEELNAVILKLNLLK